MKKISLLIATLAMSCCCFAQWNENTEENNPVWTSPNGWDGFFQLSKLISDNKGGALVPFYYSNSDPLSIYNVNINMQRIDSTGNIQWGQDGIHIADSTAWGYYTVSDGKGGAIIVYNQGLYYWGNYQLRAQHINSDGEKQWGVDGLLVNGDTSQYGLADIAIDGKGGVYICWQTVDSVEDITGYWSGSTHVQHISSEGDILWGNEGIKVSDTAFAARRSGCIVADGIGGAIITWTQTNYNSSSEEDVYAQRIDDGGNLVWGNSSIPITVAPYQQYILKMASDGNGGAFISWDYNYSESGDYLGIFAQHILADGTAAWASNGQVVSSNLVSNFLANDYYQIISDSAGGMYISWAGGNSQGLGLPVRHYNSNGEILWEQLAATGSNSNEGILQSSPQIILGYKNKLVVAWKDARNLVYGSSGYPEYYNYDIYAQQFDSAGNPTEQLNGIPVCNQDSMQAEPRILGVGKQGAIVAWQDSRVADPGSDGYGGYNIFASRIFTDTTSGPPTVDTTTSVNNIYSDNYQIKLYPNPVTNFVDIEFSKPTEGVVVLMDINGRMLDSKQVSNSYVRFDTQPYASGVYYIKWRNRTISFVKK